VVVVVGLVSGDVVGRDFLAVDVTNLRKLSRILTAALRPLAADDAPCTSSSSSSRLGECRSDAEVDRKLFVLAGGADRPRVSDRPAPARAGCWPRHALPLPLSDGRSGGGGGVDLP